MSITVRYGPASPLANAGPQSDLPAVANNKSAAPPASSTMTSQVLSPAQARLAATRRNLTLWTLQGWVALFYLAAGYAKLTEPMDNLIDLLGWPVVVADNLVRGVGLVEIVLALLLLAPLASWRIGRPLLIVGAAGLLGLQSVMLLVHAIGLQAGPAAANLILLALTAPVLILRGREACAAR